MSDVTPLARRSDWHSPSAKVPRCLFCGNVGVWWECGCATAQAIRAGKLKFRMVSRDGKAVITECSPEVLNAMRQAGVLKIAEPVTDNPEPVTDNVSCAQCGELFTPKRRDARYCSDRCRQQAHRADTTARAEAAKDYYRSLEADDEGT